MYKNISNVDADVTGFEGYVEEICRVCLNKTNCQDMCKLNYNDRKLTELFYYSTHIWLPDKKNEEYMCTACIYELLQTTEFIAKCYQSQTALNTIRKKNRSSKEIGDHEFEDVVSNLEDIVKFNDQEGEEIKEVEIAIKNLDPDKSVSKTKEDEHIKKFTETNKKKKQIKIRKYDCPTCPKMFYLKQDVEIHKRVHTKQRPFACKICGRMFTINKNLQRHMLIHTGQKPFCCEFCGRGFTQNTALQSHILVHTGERPFICEFCAKSFKTRYELNYHQRHKCSKSTSASGNSEDNSQTCKLCFAPVRSLRGLKQHMSMVHCKKEYLCNACGKKFVSLAGLKLHLQVHTEQPKFACDVCGQKFLQKSSLKYHVYTHTGERPYSCKTCGKTFVQHHHLTHHERVHSGVKPYKCQFCWKAFTLKGNLTVHERLHTGETPYICAACGSGFHDSSSLKKHQRQKHVRQGNENIVDK